MRGLVAVLLALATTTTTAHADAGAQARNAQQQLAEASEKLNAADSARNRISALTDAIQAYESGLEALRAGLRAVSIRQSQMQRALESRDTDIAALLAILQSIQPDDLPTAFLHPEGAAGTARASILLSALAPALATEAQSLRQDVEDLTALKQLQEDAVGQLRAGLRDVQQARTDLNQAMANRTDLPQRFTEDAVKLGVLLASADTLAAFAGGLSGITSDDTGWSAPDLDALKGQLPWPARGLIVRFPGEPDAAGVRRPGILLATATGALVTSPTAATIRYTGPLLDLGQVMILEMRADTLLILSGLGITYGIAGQVIAAGTPLGLMGTALQSDTAALEAQEGAGTARPETLYIEVRDQNVPQDPQDWFGTGEDG